LSALRAGQGLHPGKFLVLISVRNYKNASFIIRLEKLQVAYILGTIETIFKN
jgi:hypothetical protein